MNSPQRNLVRTTAALIVTALALVLISACGSSSKPASSGKPLDKATTVTTKLLSFEPAKLTVKAGTTVTWHVDDTIGHTVTTGTFKLGSDGLRTSQNPDGVIDMKLLPGKDIHFKFTKAGDYVYYCSIHKGMAGEIVVTP